MGEAGSFLMELLKIASISQIRSIKILPVSVAGRQRGRGRKKGQRFSRKKTQTQLLERKQNEQLWCFVGLLSGNLLCFAQVSVSIFCCPAFKWFICVLQMNNIK